MQNLDEFWCATDWGALKKRNGWDVTREGDAVTLELSAKDKERYRVLYLCNRYPCEAPSVLFVNQAGDKNDKSAWPTGTGSFFDIVKPPPNCFLCMELTREALAHHPDWRANPKSWSGERNTLIDVFNTVHRILKSPEYGGRGVI